MVSRDTVFRALSSERAYQEMRIERDGSTSLAGKHSPEEYLVYMQVYLTDALCVATRTWGPEAKSAVMNIVRKVTALGVACMEANGAPMRDMTEVDAFYKARKERVNIMHEELARLDKTQAAFNEYASRGIGRGERDFGKAWEKTTEEYNSKLDTAVKDVAQEINKALHDGLGAPSWPDQVKGDGGSMSHREEPNKQVYWPRVREFLTPAEAKAWALGVEDARACNTKSPV